MNTSSPPRRNRREPPPTSLPDHFARKGYLSVSDLVGPSWCEYNYQYGILSLSHLPPSQRPATITTEAGQTLAAAPALVAQRETTLQAGKAVHTLLENEVAPVQVVVETETKEDSWALRLLNLWCDIQSLVQMRPEKGKGKESACVREVPVYGWIHGVLVMGVIDEIAKRPLDLTEHGQNTKTWASQEDWKKSQSRRKSSTSLKKTKTSNNDAPRPLTAFFGSSQPSQPVPNVDKPASQGWAYYLSDTKTRISSWLPAEEDQFSARMQCMTYKRLFDGLLLGALSSTSPIAHGFDPNATPMDWARTFTALSLDPHQPLSEAFLRDARLVCESWGVDLAQWVGDNGADVCTLDHVRLLLELGLRGLVEDAAEGRAGGHGGGVIQDVLALTYRRQTRGRRVKRKTARAVGDDGKQDARQATLDSSLTQARNAKPDDEGVQLLLEAEVTADTATPTIEAQKNLDALQGKTDAAQAISTTLPSPPPSTPFATPLLHHPHPYHPPPPS